MEDDAHVLVGCPATGSADWAPSILEAWAEAAEACLLPVPPPALEWLHKHHMPLIAALIPKGCLLHHPLVPLDAQRLCARLHKALACRLAEWMRQRGEFGAASAPSASGLPDSQTFGGMDAPWVPGRC